MQVYVVLSLKGRILTVSFSSFNKSAKSYLIKVFRNYRGYKVQLIIVHQSYNERFLCLKPDLFLCEL